MPDPRDKEFTIIGKRVTAVEYLDVAKARREGVSHPNRTWRHDQTALKATLVGLPDGSVLITAKHMELRQLPNGDILIRSKSGKRLWKYC